MNFNKDTKIGSIPNEWDVYTVKKLIKDNVIFRPMDGNHGSIHPKTSDYVKEGIPFIMAKDLLNNNIDIINCKFITEEKAKSLKKGFAKKGDILLTHKATIGRTVIVQEIPYKFVVLTPQVTYYRIRNKDMLNNIYLKYYFDYDKFQSLLKLWSGSGSTRLYLGITAQQKLPIVVPPLAEQKAISKILSSLDEKIELNDQINKNLEEMAQAIFKHWFVDFEFPDDNGKPYKSSGGKMIESELGMIPEGWEVFKIVDLPIKITDYVANGSFKSLKENVTVTDKKDYALFIRNTDLKNNFKSNIKYVNKHSYEYLKKTKLYGGEVIISNVGDVGSVYLCPHYEIPMTLGNNVILVNSLNKDKFYNYYLYRYFKSSFGQKKIKAITGGSVQSKFNKTDFRNLKIIIPDYKIIKIYNIIFNVIEKKFFNNYIQNEKLSSLRDTLLSKLMSGEIRVPLDKEGGTQ